MEDYIDILINEMESRDREYLGWEYFHRSEQAMAAMEALEGTFSPEQKQLFRDYEDAQNAADSARGAALLRRAFLMAREIYR